MVNEKVKLLATVVMSVVIAGCGSGGTPGGLSIAANGDMTVAQGSAQKGPFIAGSTVTLNVLSPSTFIYEVDASGSIVAKRTYKLPVLSQTGKSFTLETNNQGVFDSG